MSKCAYIVHLSFLLEKRRGGRVEPHMKFSKKRGGRLDRTSFFEGVSWERGSDLSRRGLGGDGGCNFAISQKKKCIGGLPKKRGTWTVCRFKGGSW